MSIHFGGQPTVFGIDVSFIGNWGTIARDFFGEKIIKHFKVFLKIHY